MDRILPLRLVLIGMGRGREVGGSRSKSLQEEKKKIAYQGNKKVKIVPESRQIKPSFKAALQTKTTYDHVT